MKKVKKLLVRNVVALLAPFVLCGCKTNDSQSELTVQETIDIETQRENETMETFYNIITDGKEITDGTLSNQQPNFYNEKIQELWEYVDKKILSRTNYKIVKNRDCYGYSTILTSNEFSNDSKFKFESIEYSDKSIAFYQAKEGCSKANLNKSYFEVGYNIDGNIYYAYQTNVTQKQEDYKNADGKGIIIRYTPHDSMLIIIPQIHFPKTSIKYARWKEEDSITYNISNENSINTLIQLVRLYENNVTLTEINNNIDQIVNATYLQVEEKKDVVEEVIPTIEETTSVEEAMPVIEEITSVEETKEDETESVVVSNTKDKTKQMLEEAIKSTAYPQNQKVEEEIVKEIMSQLDFKSDLLKEIAPTAIEATLSNNNWNLTYQDNKFFGLADDMNCIHLESDDSSDWIYIDNNFDDSWIEFSYMNTQDSEVYSLRRYDCTIIDGISVDDIIKLFYSADRNIATVYKNNNERIDISIPDEIKEDFVCQMVNDYTNKATSEEIMEHALSFKQDKSDAKILLR